MPQAKKENQALEPKPQGATVDHVIAQSRPGSGYISMDYHQRNPAANEDDYATIKEEKGPQHMMARAHRTLSESNALGPASNGDSGVLYQQRQGPKDDTLLRRGPQDIPGANTLDRNCRPDIPDRPDLQEHTGITSGAVGSVLSTCAPSYSPFATTPRKTSRRPVPTPRRTTKARPASDGSLDRKAVRNEDEPIYDKPIQLPDPPYISKEILNHPPPSPSKRFGGTFREDLDTSFQLPPGGWDDNSAFHPFYQPPLPGYSPEEPVNPVDQPVYQTDQYVNPGGETSEGAYGEEIDARIREIREIREIFGEEVPRDWCYAALLQFQDVNQVARVIKIQKLSKLTGKSEPFCERTLSHCSWNLDRAASYIFENFEDKDV